MNLVIVILAKYLIYVIAALALVSGWITKSSRRWYLRWLLRLAIALILAYLSVKLFNDFVPEKRPFIAGNFQPLIDPGSDPSFPSDHATMAAVMATFIWQLKRSWGIIAFALAILVGIGRVSAGVHYPWDIAGGLILGIVIAVLTLKLLPRRSV